MFSRMLLLAGPGPNVGFTFHMPLIAPFFQDQLYNRHADEFYRLYQRVVSKDYQVWGCSVLYSGKNRFRTAAMFLACLDDWWVQKPRLASNGYIAYHQLSVLESLPSPKKFRIEGKNDLKVRNRFFTPIRARALEHWLDYVRLLMTAKTNYWCDDLVARVLQEQLKAWFATVPHKDVRWSIYLNERDKYRVCWWED